MANDDSAAWAYTAASVQGALNAKEDLQPQIDALVAEIASLRKRVAELEVKLGIGK